MFKKLISGIIFCSSSIYAGNITIAVAANVSYAIKTLNLEFNKLYPDTKVRVILGSSGKLTAQISNGAPYQLFMSANMMYPESLYNRGIAITKPIVYARGTLAYLSSRKQDFSTGINILKGSKIKKIAVANPKTAPYGIATKEALINSGIYNSIKSKFIYGESISQTVSYTVTAADIGFIAKSSLFSPQMSRFKYKTHWMDLDLSLYTPIKQGIVILKDGKDNKELLAFYNFILSNKAKNILKEYGYIVK